MVKIVFGAVTGKRSDHVAKKILMIYIQFAPKKTHKKQLSGQNFLTRLREKKSSKTTEKILRRNLFSHTRNNNGVAQSVHASDPPQIPADFVFLLLLDFCRVVCVIFFFFFFSKSNDFHLLAIKLRRRRIDANVRGKIPRVVR